jgi:copper chaperone CopZ
MEKATETVTLDIQGMTCDHCVRAVRAALEGVDGATVENVELGTARVRYDPERTTPARLADAVSDEGYEAFPEG